MKTIENRPFEGICIKDLTISGDIAILPLFDTSDEEFLQLICQVKAWAHA